MNRPNPSLAAAAPPRRPIVRRQAQPVPAPRALAAGPEAHAPRSLHWRFRHAEYQVAQDGLQHLEAIRDAAQALERHVEVVVERGAPKPVSLGAAAFSLVAEVRQFGDWLFDKQQVDAHSVVEKLTRAANLRFRDEVVHRLQAAGLVRAPELVLRATDAEAFKALLGAPQSPAVYLELQRRGGWLLEAEASIAHELDAGAAADWPPRAGPAKPAGQGKTK